MTQSTNIAAALLRYAPSAEVADTLSTLSGGRGGRGSVSITSGRARSMWKKGRSSVEDAVRAVELCGDAALLQEIAVKERRQGVLAAIAAHPRAELETLAGIATSARSGWEVSRSAQQQLTRWVHRQEMHPGLVERAAATEYAPALTACATHPRLDTESVAALLPRIDPAHPALARQIAQHPRLSALSEEVLLGLAAHEGVVSKMCEHADVAKLPVAVIEKLLTEGSPAYLARGGFSPAWEERMRSHWLSLDPVPWASIAALNTTPVELLGDAPLRNTQRQMSANVLGRYLAKRLGDSSVHWQLAVELLTNAEGTLGELVETLEAALGPAGGGSVE